MDHLTKKYYKIKEVAEILNIPPTTLRFWENRFTVIRPKRNEKGTRFYTPHDIEVISQIHYLVKEKGLKLEAAQEAIRVNPQGISQLQQTVARLRRVRAGLQLMYDALHRLR